LLSNPLECPLWVNFGLSRPTAATSAFRGKADEIGTITDIGQRMSAVGGRADVVCQELSGPFIVRRRHGRTPWAALNGGEAAAIRAEDDIQRAPVPIGVKA
jgi:hypothetical protein